MGTDQREAGTVKEYWRPGTFTKVASSAEIDLPTIFIAFFTNGLYEKPKEVSAFNDVVVGT